MRFVTDVNALNSIPRMGVLDNIIAFLQPSVGDEHGKTCARAVAHRDVISQARYGEVQVLETIPSHNPWVDGIQRFAFACAYP